MWPWLDRGGRLSPLKLSVFIALLAPATWIAAASVEGTIGARPLNEAILQFGLWTLRWLFLALAVTPLCGILAYPPLLAARRMIGVGAFAYGLVHLALYAADQAFDLPRVAAEILSRVYLTIGFAALAGLALLAAVSNDAMLRRLGGRSWRRLNRLVYPIAALATVHFFLQSKLDEWEPMVMAGLFAWLLGYRLLARGLRPGEPPPLIRVALLGAAAALFTALGESLYFRLLMGVDPLRVLAVNFSFATGTRPAVVVFLTTLALTVALGIRHLGRPSGKRPAAARTGAPIGGSAPLGALAVRPLQGSAGGRSLRKIWGASRTCELLF